MIIQAKTSALDDWRIQPLTDAHRAALLRLNANHYPAVHTLDEATLDELLTCRAGYHRVAVDRTSTVYGYLLSFSRESNYDDSEISELRRRLTEPFVYICQIVVASEYRKRGIARAFYAAVADTARDHGIRWLCCDVNINPPNPDSFAFHQRLGFREIGQGTASNGFAIAYLAQPL